MSAAGAVRAGFALDDARLSAWMTDHVAGFSGPLSIGQFSGGQSNPTYRLDTPSGVYVLRRKPPGPILKGAHDVLREARVMQALGGAGYPVPRILAVCEDETVAGTPFYVMAHVEGRIFWDATLSALPATDRPAIFDAMNDAIARLHVIDVEAVGLSDYGRPGAFVARQVSRWARQYREDVEAGRDDNMDRVIEWLSDNIPDDDQTVVAHGDFRIDNLIFHPTEPRVLAVIDWELSTLGHPLADFAYHLMMYRMPGRIIAGLAGENLRSLNLPDEQDYIAAYCGRTGRDGIPDIETYLTFNMFRFAAIIHGIRGRVLRGTAVSDEARTRAAQFPELAAMAWAQAQRAMRNVS